MSHVRTMDDFEAAQRYSDAAITARAMLYDRARRTTTGDWYFKFRGWWWVRDRRRGCVAACSPISTGNQPTRRARANQYLNFGGLG